MQERKRWLGQGEEKGPKQFIIALSFNNN